MSVERRDQQNLNLVTGAFNTPRGIAKRYSDSEQLELLSSRWTRIRLRTKEKETIFNNLLHHINVETRRSLQGLRWIESHRSRWHK